MKKLFLLLLVFCLANLLSAQPPTATWKGGLHPTGAKDTFTYELQLQFNGREVTATAICKSPNGATARFAAKGSWDGQKMLLQEWKQEEPAGARWCLKYLKLEYGVDQSGQTQLAGSWSAEGCGDGVVWLYPFGNNGRKLSAARGRLGRWTGHLDQADRAYGFFYEIVLAEAGNGSSHIVSEDSGGKATHELQWLWDSSRQVVTILEKRVLEKTDPNWPWCIKRAELTLQNFPDRQVLSGDWSGIIEGYSLQDGGACASGQMYLEKPIIHVETQQKVEDKISIYEQEYQRDLRLDRVLRVQSRNLRIRIWDNGTVDGDIVTIF